MTRKELYERGAALLARAQVPDPRYDARRLFGQVSGISHAAYLADPDLPVSDVTARDYLQLCEKRAARTPLQHLTGEQEFMGLTFQTGPQVLIPRCDTEVLVESVQAWLSEQGSGLRLPGDRGREILDLGCGSGCILISLLHGLGGGDWKGLGADISPEALALAQENACANGVGEQITWRQSDWFSSIGETDFSVIVSNPPYIASDVIGTLEPEVADHEPHAALDGGPDGLDAYRAIVPQAGEHLAGGGLLAVEIGWDQGKAVSAMFTEQGFADVRIRRDLAGLDRVVLGVRKLAFPAKS